VLRPSRLLAIGSLVSIGLLYWHPLRAYRQTDALLRTREGQVSALRAQTHELQARIATVGSSEGLVREARRLGFVKPGEQLFIVRGIAGWRATH
jgi:cell division protein FtsB